MFRPLPEALLREYLGGKKRVAVLDRDTCPGLGGIVWSEIRGLVDPGAVIQSYMIGLGGGDIRREHVASIVNDVRKRERAGEPVLVETGA
jgi:pyruvate/2-oxoacid:ferredoxin oxidoreductase alpha subunit